VCAAQNKKIVLVVTVNVCVFSALHKCLVFLSKHYVCYFFSVAASSARLDRRATTVVWLSIKIKFALFVYKKQSSSSSFQSDFFSMFVRAFISLVING
jgi:hypothetical protein